jgi:Cdc6-like AAA superfamily ATPase
MRKILIIGEQGTGKTTKAKKILNEFLKLPDYSTPDCYNEALITEQIVIDKYFIDGWIPSTTFISVLIEGAKYLSDIEYNILMLTDTSVEILIMTSQILTKEDIENSDSRYLNDVELIECNYGINKNQSKAGNE